MTRTWPPFVTRDLGDSEADFAEMMRRWEVYDREMKALIATGSLRRDEDGWWVDKATGELVGPDPEIERPLTDEELANFKPLQEAVPDLAESIRRSRGRPRVENPKEAVTLRLAPATLAKFKATGKDWRARMTKILEEAEV